MKISSPSRNTSARKPSHFGSKTQSPSAGNSSSRFASIGRIGGFTGRCTPHGITWLLEGWKDLFGIEEHLRRASYAISRQPLAPPASLGAKCLRPLFIVHPRSKCQPKGTAAYETPIRLRGYFAARALRHRRRQNERHATAH